MKYVIDGITFCDFYFRGHPSAGLAGNNTKYSWIRITQMLGKNPTEDEIARHGDDLRNRIIERWNINPEWFKAITKEQYHAKQR